MARPEISSYGHVHRVLHLPGVDNVAADFLSRGGPRPGEWWLHPEQASHLDPVQEVTDGVFCLPGDYSVFPLVLSGPKGNTGVDAIAYNWPLGLYYSFHPFSSTGQDSRVTSQSPAHSSRLATPAMDARSGCIAQGDPSSKYLFLNYLVSCLWME